MFFKSLKSRIIVSITGIVLLSLTITISFIGKWAEHELENEFATNSLNLLHATRNHIESQHNSILYHESSVLLRRKVELKDKIEIALKVVESSWQEYKDGVVSEQEAKNRAVKFTRQMRYDKGTGYFWIMNSDRPLPLFLMHGIMAELEGGMLTDPKYASALGTGENLTKAMVDLCLEQGEGFVEYLWEKQTPAGLTEQQPKLSYVKIFKPWNWIIGTGVYIDDIEKDVQHRIDAVIADLNRIILRQKIGESGYFFVFDEKNHALVHPHLTGQDVGHLINPSTGSILVEDFKKAALTGGGTLEYLWDKPGAEGDFSFTKKAFITYYKPLGWYLCTTVYKEDLEYKISNMLDPMILFSCSFLVMALILSFYISRSITLPLQKLIDSIGRTDKSGIPFAIRPQNGTTEIKVLCSTMNNMLESISRSRKELKDERDFSTELINTTPDLICRLDGEGSTTFLNPAAERVTGYSRDKIMGKNWWREFYPGKEYAQVEEMAAKFSGCEIADHEMILTCKGGERRNIVWNSLTKRDKENNIREIIGFGNDITERKQTEKALLESEKELRTIFDNSVETIYHLNLLTGTYDYLSPSCEDTFGYTQEEMMQRGVKGTASSLHPDDLLPLQSHIEKLLSKTVEKKISPTVEYRFRHKKLGYRWIRDTRKVMFDERGKAAAIIGSTMDITDRKEAEEASRLSEKRYKSFIAHAHEGIYRINFSATIDIDLPRQQLQEKIRKYAVIKEVNEALARLYGCEAEEMIGRPATDFAPDYGKRVIQMLDNKSYQFSEETEDIDKDGNPLYLHESFHGEVVDGKLISVWGVQINITNLKKVQQELRTRDEIFGRMMKNYPGVAYIIDKDGYYLFDEGKGLQKIGLRPNQVVEERWNAFEVYRNNPELIGALNNALKGDVSYLTTREHGEYFDLWFGPYCDEEGNIIGILGMAENSTEKQVAKVALFESEKRFRELFDNMTNGCTIYETEDGIDFYMKDMNRGAENLDSVKKGNMVGKSVAELFPDAVDKGALEPFQTTWRSGESTRFTASYQVEGREVYRDNFFYKLPSGEVVVVFYDITERKEAEEALRRSEERYRAVISAIPDLLFRISKDHYFVDCHIGNPELMLMMPEHFLGHHISENLPENIVKRTKGIIAKTLNTKKLQSYEYSLKLPDGLHHFESRMVPSGADEVLAIVRDITELKEQEQELRQLRNYLSSIIDSMPSVLVGIDGDGNVTQWNKTAEQTTGISAGVAQGRNLNDVYPQMKFEIKQIVESIRTREIRKEQKRSRHGTDGIVYEDVTIYPLVASGVDGAVIRIDDVTDMVRMEEMMLQSEKMLSVGGLAAGMAHEINNPLAGMMQTAGVMGSRLGGDVDIPANRKAAERAGTTMEAIKEFMEIRGVLGMIKTINDSGQRVAAIISNMLSFARKSENMTAFHPFEDLLDKTLELAATDYDLKKQYDFKLIEIRREYGEMVPSVACEKVKIQQVLLNIFKNGAQAMYEAGTEHPCFIVRTSFMEARQMVCLEIEDNGPGMDEVTRKRVFEPFFTTKPEGVGTGLGLSVSYFIITEDHGGELAVESEPGKGSKFIIRLPLGGIK